LRSPYFVERVVANSTGVSFPAINESEMATFDLAVPPEAEQRSIAAFLNRETARIDALITMKEQLIERLRERREGTISRAVTRGLDPHALMKRVGLPWLEEVPRDWVPWTVKRLFRQTKRQGHNGETILSVYRDYGVIEKSSRDDNHNRTPEDLAAYQLVEPGDLVINKMKAWQGSLGISDVRGITSPDYVVYSARHREEPRFLHHLFRNKQMASLYLSLSNGIRPSQWRLEPDKFDDVVVFLPPRDEQITICKHIESVRVGIDQLLEQVGTAVLHLRELRMALISGAVTGKFDVGNEAA
jgi:type I restriction enzyme, S subunit